MNKLFLLLLIIFLKGCGCILAELFNGEALFRGDGEISQLREIFLVRGLPAESDWPSDTAMTRDSFPPSQPRVSRC